MGGAIGSGSAIVAQVLSARAARTHLEKELSFRREELWAQFASPSLVARADAFGRLYDYLQDAIEERRISIDRYTSIRVLLIYLPEALASKTITGLKRLMSADRDEVAAGIEISREVQASLRTLLGLNRIDLMMSEERKQV